jgi:tRNA modification GTPase
MDWEDTIVGPATATSSGARMILRLSGPQAHAVVASFLASPPTLPWKTSVRSVTISIPAWSRSVDAELYTWPEQSSYTGQRSAELHLPACPPLAVQLQTQLIRAGARLARPGEFTLRAFLNGKLDLAQAEGVLGLIEAQTTEQLRQAIDQRAGGISRPVATLRSDLLNLLADLEAGLDFVDEDISFISKEQLERRLGENLTEIDTLTARLGQRLLEANLPRIVLIGPPNAGKSTLLNALAEDAKAIVSPIAGTTRDVVSARVWLGDRLVEVVDTAGWDDSQEEIMRQAQSQRTRFLDAAHLILLCVPADQTAQKSLLKSDRTLVLHTKADLAPLHGSPLPSVSIHDPGSITRLRQRLARHLVDAAPKPGEVSISERCRVSLAEAAASLRQAHELSQGDAGQEYVAVAIRAALDHLGEMVGAVYTDDLLDRIFSRFCIGK